MTVLRAAGPRTRLQLLRLRAHERPVPDAKYVVRLLEDTGVRDIHAGRRFGAAYEALQIEADWRGWPVRDTGGVA
jgi:hypothetical protein